MVEQNKFTLQLANEAISEGDYERFLSFCTDDTYWTFVGDRVLKGKEDIRKYFKEVYLEPPIFDVKSTVAEVDKVIAMGIINLKSADGSFQRYEYCDDWTFSGGKLHMLNAYVIAI